MLRRRTCLCANSGTAHAIVPTTPTWGSHKYEATRIAFLMNVHAPCHHRLILTDSKTNRAESYFFHHNSVSLISLKEMATYLKSRKCRRCPLPHDHARSCGHEEVMNMRIHSKKLKDDEKGKIINLYFFRYSLIIHKLE